MKHYGDITKISGYDIPIVDIITGGSPCQDLSVAGKRAGLAGERSGLFMEQIRIIKEMREHDRLSNTRANEHIRPRYMVWENVPGAFSSNGGEDFRAVLEETAKVADKTATIPRPEGGRWMPSGCILGAGWSIAWRVHDAQFWGVPQRRKRIALVADFGGNTAPEILFERKSVSRDIAESGEQGKAIAGDIGKSVETAISFQERFGKPGGGKGLLIQDEHVGALSTVNNQSVAYGMNRERCGAVYAKDIMPTLQAAAGESGNNKPMVCYGMSSYQSNAMLSSNPNSGIYEARTARTLDNNGANPACNQGGMMILCDAYQHHGYRESETCGTLTADQNTSVRGDTPIVIEGNGSRPSHQGDGFLKSETMYTLNSTEKHAVCIGGGMLHDALHPEPICKTLNCMDDVMKVMTYGVDAHNVGVSDNKTNTLCAGRNDNHNVPTVCYGLDRASFNQGQNARYDFSVEQELAQTLVAKGPGGGISETVNALCASDCKGVGEQYVNDKKIIVQSMKGKKNG